MSTFVDDGAPAGVARVADVFEDFRTFKTQQLEDGELSPRTLDGYLRATKLFEEVLGEEPIEDLRPADFAKVRAVLTQRLGPRSVGTYIRMIKTAFSWAYDSELIDRPVRYGRMFQPPSVATIRRAAEENAGRQVYEAWEIRRLIDHASLRMKAWLWVGINAAYGPTDLSSLPAPTARQAAETALLTFPRPKTAIKRQAFLWPETRDAIAETVNEGEGPAWTTMRGMALVRNKVHKDAEGQVARVTAIDNVSKDFAKLTARAGVENLGFYALRHTFDTIADRARDPHAQLRCMGHNLPGMSHVYVARIDWDRIERVCNTVKEWLDSG